MFPSTITVGSVVFNKVSEDRQSGTLYLSSDSTRVNPTTLAVKHDIPGLGKKGTARHLLSYSTPMLDADSNPTTDRVSINFTINVPQVAYGDDQITRALTEMLSVLNNAIDPDVGVAVSDTVDNTLSPISLLAKGHF